MTERTDTEFKEMVAGNTWHDLPELDQLVEAVKFCAQPGFVWSWTRTPSWAGKYINVRIDMRDGGFVIMDRENRRISVEELKAMGLEKTA